MTENVIIIPTRLEATRLPNKPLKKINEKGFLSVIITNQSAVAKGTVTIEHK